MIFVISLSTRNLKVMTMMMMMMMTVTINQVKKRVKYL
jgi:hypothetical protein